MLPPLDAFRVTFTLEDKETIAEKLLLEKKQKEDQEKRILQEKQKAKEMQQEIDERTAFLIQKEKYIQAVGNPKEFLNALEKREYTRIDGFFEQQKISGINATVQNIIKNIIPDTLFFLNRDIQSNYLEDTHYLKVFNIILMNINLQEVSSQKIWGFHEYITNEIAKLPKLEQEIAKTKEALSTAQTEFTAISNHKTGRENEIAHPYAECLEKAVQHAAYSLTLYEKSILSERNGSSNSKDTATQKVHAISSRLHFLAQSHSGLTQRMGLLRQCHNTIKATFPSCCKIDQRYRTASEKVKGMR